MVSKYTPNARPIMPKKQQLKPLSTHQNIAWFTSALGSLEGRCIGTAKTQHRRCRNPISHHSWFAAMEEVIDIAEDPTLEADDLEDEVAALAHRLCCHHHRSQQGPPMALFNAIELHRKEFAIYEPALNIPSGAHHSFDGPHDGYHCDACDETVASASNLEPEQATSALEAAVEKRVNDLEARLERKLDQISKNHVGPAVPAEQIKTEQDTAALDAVFERIAEKLSGFEARLESKINKLRNVQSRHEKDMRTLAANIQRVQDAAALTMKEKRVPALSENVTMSLEQMASLLKQQKLMLDACFRK